MKILVISDMYPSTFNEINGIFVHKQVKALITKGLEVQVVSPVPWTPFPINYLSSKWKKYSTIPVRRVYEGINIWYPRYVTFPRAWFFDSLGQRIYLGVKDVIKKIYQNFQFDLIHAHVALPDGFAGMKIAKKYKKPLFVTIHGQDFHDTIFRNEKCRRNLERIVNYSARTIAVSEKLKKIGEKYLQINSNKIVVIPNGISISDIYREQSKISQEYHGRKIILSVSRLTKAKGIDLNLKAISKLKRKYPHIIYLIVGEGKEKENLEELVNKLNLKSIVKFIRELPHHKVMEYMAACDIFSLPSWMEGFGVVYIEAMAHGKPVIGCQGEGIEDFVKDGKTGLLVKPRDVDSLANVMDCLLCNADEAQAMGERARKVVLEDYTWEKNAEKISKIYNNY